MSFIIRERKGKKSWYCKQTIIGPMFTSDIEQAARFETRMDMIPIVQSHFTAFTLCEVEEYPPKKRKARKK